MKLISSAHQAYCYDFVSDWMHSEDAGDIMAFHADPSIPKTIDEWLEQFEMFSIYEILPEILELWGTNLITDVESKKNLVRATGK